MGVPALPPIVISAAAGGPVAVGLLRPRVVLPEGLAESISEPFAVRRARSRVRHVLRRDAWVGLLQRVAGALFWPHPFVHYLNGQLTRAREEVCDNHVLRCGDACGYARTAPGIDDLCRPLASHRPGLGLLAARWTLTDRVAGLLDPGRISMTRTSLRMKVAMAIALGRDGDIRRLRPNRRLGSSGRTEGAQDDLKIAVAGDSQCRLLEH